MSRPNILDAESLRRRRLPPAAMTWSRFQQNFHHYPELGLSLDLSRLPIADDFLAAMEPRMQQAFGP